MAAPKRARKVYDSEIEPEDQLAIPRLAPATSPEARENQLIGLAYDLAEKQFRDGTASSQVITHFLKMGSSRERLEQLKISGEVRLNDTKIENMESGARTEELYSKAMKAMSVYSGQEQTDED
ncbi:hypothetical protein SEA_CATERPILLAR_2 [Arthrobacter phage Caterpillar]|nr:hypothetical protein SEA_CATERPILLAR_2 [Arthrobacter phage Caterpillar]